MEQNPRVTTAALSRTNSRMPSDRGCSPTSTTRGDGQEEWDGLDDLREQHQQALDRWASAGSAQLSREQAESPSRLNIKERREREAAIHREVAAEVSRIVWEARDLIDEWRSVEDATEAERRAEIEQLRARLAQLEVEDLMRRAVGRLAQPA